MDSRATSTLQTPQVCEFQGIFPTLEGSRATSAPRDLNLRELFHLWRVPEAPQTTQYLRDGNFREYFHHLHTVPEAQNAAPKLQIPKHNPQNPAPQRLPKPVGFMDWDNWGVMPRKGHSSWPKLFPGSAGIFQECRVNSPSLHHPSAPGVG